MKTKAKLLCATIVMALTFATPLPSLAAGKMAPSWKVGCMVDSARRNYGVGWGLAVLIGAAIIGIIDYFADKGNSGK